MVKVSGVALEAEMHLEAVGDLVDIPGRDVIPDAVDAVVVFLPCHVYLEVCDADGPRGGREKIGILGRSLITPEIEEGKITLGLEAKLSFKGVSGLVGKKAGGRQALAEGLFHFLKGGLEHAGFIAGDDPGGLVEGQARTAELEL